MPFLTAKTPFSGHLGKQKVRKRSSGGKEKVRESQTSLLSISTRVSFSCS